MAHRKAASVLPEPVGAHSSVWSPAAIGPQAPVWAAVGSTNEVANHALTAAENCCSVAEPGDGVALGSGRSDATA